MTKRCLPMMAVLCLTLGYALPVQASILVFDIFDSDPFFLDGNYNNPGVQPFYSAGFGYPEGFRIYSGYGNGVGATEVDVNSGAIKFRYGVGGEGFTPNVNVSYGPYSLFTGGPTLWREGYSGLAGVLYQGSGENGSPIGFDYDVLDIVFVADPGYDVVLHEFDLGSFGGDRTINSIMAFDGVPFPFLTPTNFLSGPTGPVAVTQAGGYHHDFGGTPLQSSIIWLRIDMTNLGNDSINIGIDNIRFGQVENPLHTVAFDPSRIDAAFQSAEVPEPASLTLWLMAGAIALVVRARSKSLE